MSPEELDAELARLDREWEVEREQYLMQGRMGKKYRPSAAAGIVAVMVGGGLGLLWTIGTSLAAGRGNGAAALLPVLGVVFTLLSVAFGASGIWKARAYRRAERAYLARRERLLADESEGGNPPQRAATP